MYLNFIEFNKSKLTSSQLVCMIAIYLKKSEEINLDDLDVLRERKLVTFIKGTPKQSQVEKVRLSERGKELLLSFSESEVLEEDVVIGEWLVNYYKRAGKIVKSKPKVIRLLRDFRIKSGISKNNLAKLCKAFLSDEDNMKFNNILENAIYTPPSAYASRFKLEDSRLYQYYLNRKDFFDKQVFNHDE